MSDNLDKTEFKFRFALGTRVIVDNCNSLIMRVIGISVNVNAISYQLSWFSDQGPKSEWFDDFRISRSTKTEMR